MNVAETLISHSLEGTVRLQHDNLLGKDKAGQIKYTDPCWSIDKRKLSQKNEEALKPSGGRYFSAKFILISYLLAEWFFSLIH